MGERERLTVGALITGVALFLPGLLFHSAPRFPGSLVGGLLGIAAALLFVALLAYTAVKRIAWLKQRLPIGAMLSFHVYAGAVGAALGVLHTGHRYQSPLGVALVIAMLLVVMTGFVGRYYLLQIGTDIRIRQQELMTLRARFDAMVSGQAEAFPDPTPILPLIAGIADLENTIGRDEVLKGVLARWVVAHILASLVLYPLLVLHVWSAVYYGLRWWR